MLASHNAWQSCTMQLAGANTSSRGCHYYKDIACLSSKVTYRPPMSSWDHCMHAWCMPPTSTTPPWHIAHLWYTLEGKPMVVEIGIQALASVRCKLSAQQQTKTCSRRPESLLMSARVMASHRAAVLNKIFGTLRLLLIRSRCSVLHDPAGCTWHSLSKHLPRDGCLKHIAARLVQVGCSQ